MSKKRRPPTSASESILSTSLSREHREGDGPPRRITWDESNLRFNESLLTSSFVKMKLRDLPPPPQSENEISEEDDEDSADNTWEQSDLQILMLMREQEKRRKVSE
eukprot:TRINITY_DN338_c5_g1_i1.p1 TRINITY_DN338_c5_g1~~TRINITY_DN338_c5_g1_i1.p1  ORF type:complete len:115 (+),score=26.62 TRINITY_DN338_c5_g1_i1:28-345(+)